MGRSRSKPKASKSKRDRRVARARAAREGRRVVVAEREARRRIEELFSDDTPVERSAELLLERLGEGPVPARFSRFLAIGGSEERARAVAEAVARRSPDSAAALTLAADVALHVDEDPRAASRLLDRALEAGGGELDPAGLASHLVGAGRVADGLRLVEDLLVDEPDDDEAQEVRAEALEIAFERRCTGAAPRSCPCWSGRAWVDCCAAAEAAALERFADREPLYGLRRAMLQFVATDATVGVVVDEAVEEWLKRAGPGDDAREALRSAAIEHAWIVGSDEGDPHDSDAPLALLADRPETPAEPAVAARRWLAHCEYGLWQVADPVPSPGVWLTDIVSGRRRYAAIAPEQMESMARWTVLLGALVAIDGTWRTTSSFVALRPSEGDAAAELAEEMFYGIVSAMAGEQLGPGRRERSDAPEPYGIQVNETEPASPQVADLLGRVVGSGMPHLVEMVQAARDAAPRLVNTDGDRICLVKATVALHDPSAAFAALVEHPDIEADGDALTWWGRELDALERETAAAELRAQLRQRGEDAEFEDESQRWMRGRVLRADGGLEVEVNSRERLDRFLDLLRELGERPMVSATLVIDPEQDLPLLRAGTAIPMNASADAHAAWVAHWPDQRLPALGGRTPRQAATRGDVRPRLEALLRELEHDADLLASRGQAVPDIAKLREELRMPAAAWGR
jgi:hypothetical protein